MANLFLTLFLQLWKERRTFPWSTGRGRNPKQAQTGSQWQRLPGRELCLLLQCCGQSARPLLEMSCFPWGSGGGRGLAGTEVTQPLWTSKDCSGSHWCAAPSCLPVQEGMQKVLLVVIKCGGGITGVDLIFFDLLYFVSWRTLIEGCSAGRLQLWRD